MTRGAHIRRGQEKSDYYRERVLWGKCLVRRDFYRGLGAKSVAPGLERVTRRCDGDGAGRDCRETAGGCKPRLVVSRRSESARDASRSDELAALARSISVATPRLTRGGAGETAARAGNAHAYVRACVHRCVRQQ